MWTPDKEELIRTWLAALELRAAEIIGFNTYESYAIPTNAREFLRAINHESMDLMRGGSCISSPSSLIDMLAKEKKVTATALFSEADLAVGMADLDRIDALRHEAKNHDGPILGKVTQSLSGASNGLRALLEASLGIGSGAFFGVALAFILVGNYPEKSPWFLAFFALVYIYETYSLLGSAFNPARRFLFAERARERQRTGNGPRFGVTFYVAADVGVFVAAFLATCIAWESAQPGTFNNVEAANIPQWWLYFADTLVRTVGLDLAEIFRIDVSPIKHSDAFLPAMFVFLFRTTLSVLGISIIVSAARRYG